MHTTPHSCPNCNRTNDYVTAIGSKEEPRPNDITICFCCGFIEQYDTRMERAPLTLDQFDKLPTDERAKLLRHEIARIQMLMLSGPVPKRPT